MLYRDELKQLQRLQCDIMRQVDAFESLLKDRLTLTLSDLESVSDLGSLAVIHEVSCLFVVCWWCFLVDNFIGRCLRLLNQPVCRVVRLLVFVLIDT